MMQGSDGWQLILELCLSRVLLRDKYISDGQQDMSIISVYTPTHRAPAEMKEVL